MSMRHPRLFLPYIFSSDVSFMLARATHVVLHIVPVGGAVAFRRCFAFFSSFCS